MRLSSAVAVMLAAGFGSAASAQYGTIGGYNSFVGASPLAPPTYSYFHLETFEDGALNTPGVTANAGFVLNSGSLTDSVDEDDGVFDSSGTAGRSWYSGGSTSLVFTFNAGVLGALPDSVAIAWTDVGYTFSGNNGVGIVEFECFDASNLSLGVFTFGPLGDGAFAGQTAEDTLFFAFHAGGISSLRITMPDSSDWEVDHLQYGLQIPSPGSLALALTATGAGWRRRRAETR